MSETRDNLLIELNIPTETTFPLLEQLDQAEHRYIKDLKINLPL